MVGLEAAMIDVTQEHGAGGPELACGAINILQLLHSLPLTQKASLGSKPNLPIMPSIYLVTLAREAEEGSVRFAPSLISMSTVYPFCW